MRQLTRREAQQIKKQAQGIDATAKTPLAQQMLTFWKEHRPQMAARLVKLGILEEFAVVQEERYDQELVRLIQEESMNNSEAALIAGEHLLMTPEDEETTEPRKRQGLTTT